MEMSYDKTLKHIVKKYYIDLEQQLPIKIQIDRHRGLTKLWRELGFKVGVEIGADQGMYTKWIFVKTKPEKMYIVDPYKAYKGYIEGETTWTKEVFDKKIIEAKERLARWNVEFIRKTSMEAVKDFVDESLDFIFIDGNHTFEYVINDIAEWEKKIKPGGIISGHDYWSSYDRKKYYIDGLTERQRIKLVQVNYAVDAWTKANRINPWFKTKDLCWFYIKNETRN